MESPRPKEYSDKQLLGFLQVLAVDLGRSPTVSDVRNLGEILPDVSTFERRFGSWNDALQTAGLEGLHDKSDETLLKALASLAERLGGRAPTKREVDACPDVASSGTLRNRFGSHSAAVALALNPQSLAVVDESPQGDEAHLSERNS